MSNTIYVPQTWIDEANSCTPITADRLNHMEQGIKACADAWDSIFRIRQIQTKNYNFGLLSVGVGVAKTVNISEFGFIKTPFVIDASHTNDQYFMSAITKITTTEVGVGCTASSVRGCIASGTLVFIEPF